MASENPPRSAPEQATALTQSSVIFLKIPDFADKAVAEQAKLRMRLDAAITAGIDGLPDSARVVLDTPDGAAIVVPGATRQAIDVVWRVTTGATASGSPLCIGVNHGPVKVDQRDSSALRMLGDGIDAAATVAGFATPERFLVSKSFREALAREAPHIAETLHDAGTFVDGRVRSHTLFAMDAPATRARERRRAVFGVVAILCLLGIGVAARVVRQDYEEARKPATIVLDVKPSGAVFIDGEMKGEVPPLTSLSIPPGAHVIEIRNGKFRPFRIDVNLKPGEEIAIRHVFVSSPARKAPPPEKPGLLDRLRFWR